MTAAELTIIDWIFLGFLLLTCLTTQIVTLVVLARQTRQVAASKREAQHNRKLALSIEADVRRNRDALRSLAFALDQPQIAKALFEPPSMFGLSGPSEVSLVNGGNG